MSVSVLDLQRASWSCMIGLNERSVALDIGSGYGAITHSLSRAAGEVYSVEAIPERIEFVQERLRQEGIHNVQLIQASATALPLVESSFDLVVANGILEWIGEWDLQGDPRSAQLKFLRTICGLLRNDGLLVIGIENRFGYTSLLTGGDHSGVPYTSLMPRRVASLVLRHSSRPHYRTQLNPKKEYRTYTYSERGYRKLLADAGFADASFYWAVPGYNNPYHLVPLALPQWVREHFVQQLEAQPIAIYRSWIGRLARVIAQTSILFWLLQDYVIVASKLPGNQTKVHSWVKEQLAKSDDERDDRARHVSAIRWALYTQAFSSKSVVRIGNAISGRDVAYIKIGDQNRTSDFEGELINGERIREQLETSVARNIRVPQGYGSLRVGNTNYQMQSAAPGIQFSRIVRRPGYFADMRKVEAEFTQVFGAVLELTEALQKLRRVRALPSSWREIPRELNDCPRIRAAVEEARYFTGPPANMAWIQHGDLSVEHISVDQTAGRIEIFDWENMAAGFPPLYDIFQLFFTSGYLSQENEVVSFPRADERWVASFNAIFFSDTKFARIVLKLILHACERFNLEPQLIPSLLLEFLLIRLRFPKAATQRQLHLRLLEFCFEQDRSVLGKFQLADKRTPLLASK